MNKRKSDPEDNDSNFVQSKVSDWLKKTLLTGAGAVFMTEEGIRNALSELKMPKNMIASAVAQADKTKREVSSLIANEVRHFLDRIKVEDIIKKALEGQTLEISASIRFSGDKSTSKKKSAKKTDFDDENS